MPFLNQIITFIDGALKAGSLNQKKLQPVTFHGLATVSTRKSKKPGIKLDIVPAIVTATGVEYLVPNSKSPMQIYHKLTLKTYGLEKKSHGDGYYIKSSCEMAMVVFTNSKITGKTKDVLEPIILFGIPQKLSAALIADLGINNCLITPLGSVMDPVQVFRQEFPNQDYFLDDQSSMFLIRYKIETTFSRACVESCLCE